MSELERLQIRGIRNSGLKWPATMVSRNGASELTPKSDTPLTPEQEQIRKCQRPGGAAELPYQAWHRDADRRHKAGQRQVICLTCQRYQWPDQLCALAQVDLAGRQSRQYKTVTCDRCGQSVRENWLIRHRKSGCKVGVVEAQS